MCNVKGCHRSESAAQKSHLRHCAAPATQLRQLDKHTGIDKLVNLSAKDTIGAAAFDLFCTHGENVYGEEL